MLFPRTRERLRERAGPESPEVAAARAAVAAARSRLHTRHALVLAVLASALAAGLLGRPWIAVALAGVGVTGAWWAGRARAAANAARRRLRAAKRRARRPREPRGPQSS